MDKIDNRSEIQEKALQAWIKNKYNGTLNIATGVGKGFIAIKACLLVKDKAQRQIHVLHLAERSNREQTFKDQLVEYKNMFGADYDNINIVYKRYQGINSLDFTYVWDLIIMDEIHDALSPEYRSAFQLRCRSRLGLSATIPNVKYELNGKITSKHVILNTHCPIVFHYTLKQSTEDSNTRPIDLYLIECKLNDEEAEYYSNLTTKIQDSYNNTRKKMLGATRANFMNTTYEKLDHCKKLIAFFEETKQKSIIFGSNIDTLTILLNDKVFTGVNKKQNSRIEADYSLGLINCIGSFKMLKQGSNIPGLDNCVILTLNSTNLETDLKQKVGRLRLGADYNANVIVFYNKNTVENKYPLMVSRLLYPKNTYHDLNNIYGK